MKLVRFGAFVVNEDAINCIKCNEDGSYQVYLRAQGDAIGGIMRGPAGDDVKAYLDGNNVTVTEEAKAQTATIQAIPNPFERRR